MLSTIDVYNCIRVEAADHDIKVEDECFQPSNHVFAFISLALKLKVLMKKVYSNQPILLMRNERDNRECHNIIHEYVQVIDRCITYIKQFSNERKLIKVSVSIAYFIFTLRSFSTDLEKLSEHFQNKYRVCVVKPSTPCQWQSVQRELFPVVLKVDDIPSFSAVAPQHLNQIIISCNTIAAVQQVFEAVSSKDVFNKVHEIRINNVLDTTIGDVVCHYSPYCTQLKSVTFSNCRHITDAAVQNCCLAGTLLAVNFSGCENITDAAASYLLQCQSLQIANFFNCRQITDAAAQCLSRCRCLRVMDFGQTCVTDAAAQHLSQCQHLQKVKFSGCKELTDAAAEHLSKCPDLRSVSFSGCKKITRKTVDSLSSCKALTEVFLDSKVGSDEHIHSKLMNCQVTLNA